VKKGKHRVAKKSFIRSIESDPRPGDSSARTLIEQTYLLLREDILNGTLAPGEKLIIERLKDRYAVGAGTLREAMSRLVSEAMVSAEGQRGFAVTQISLEDLVDVTNVRVRFETDALRASIRHGDKSWRARLGFAFERLSALEQPLIPENALTWEAANAEFHEALLSACGSQWTLRVIRLLTQRCERYRRYLIGLKSGRDVHAEHQLIYESAIAGNETRAALALEAHICETTELIKRAFEDGEKTICAS